MPKSNNAWRCAGPKLRYGIMLMLKPLRFCTLNWTRCLQVACCLLVGKGGGSRTGSVVPACDDRRTGSFGKWQLKWLGKPGWTGLGLNLYLCYEEISDCPSLWNGSFHAASFLCTNPLSIVQLQQDYPTDCKTVSECLY
jgi:hypothetical protein